MNRNLLSARLTRTGFISTALLAGTVLALPAVVTAVRPAVAQEAPAGLKVGDAAPDFKLVGTDGKTYTLGQFKGKSAVVIAWYPKALTGGCTKECASLRDVMDKLSTYKVQVFGASVDTVELNKQFTDQLKLNYPLLSDTDKSYAKTLGVLNPAGTVAQRWTYIIDDQGVIREIDKKVATATHGADVAAKLETLGIPKK